MKLREGATAVWSRPPTLDGTRPAEADPCSHPRPCFCFVCIVLIDGWWVRCEVGMVLGEHGDQQKRKQQQKQCMFNPNPSSC